MKLSRFKAWQCELALTKPYRCRCRCEGRCHGARRVSSPDALDDLPFDDPHFPHGGHPQLPLWDDDHQEDDHADVNSYL